MHRALPSALLLLILAAGCGPVRFISDYDEETDRRTTELHRHLEEVLTAIEEETLSASQQLFWEHAYPRLLVDLRALKLRAASRPMNELQVAQFEELEAQLRLFAETYREGIASEEVPLFRRGFDQTFRAILTLELAKKRGDT